MTVPTADAGALAHQLVHDLNNPEQRARLGEAGRRRVLDRFTWARRPKAPPSSTGSSSKRTRGGVPVRPNAC